MRDFEKMHEKFGQYYSCAFDFSKKEAVPKEIFGLFLKRIIRLISDFSKKPFKELKILDIASFEGLFSTELARLGADVTGIEGRSVNVEKAEFLKNYSGISGVKFIQDDIRNISREKYGEFDIVLAAGILYHLEAEEHFKLIKNIYDMCRGFAIIDTHVSLARLKSYKYKGGEYWGREIKEFENCESEKGRESIMTQSAIKNEKSFWPTKVSLYNLLADAGFTSVLECAVPTVDICRGGYDRITVVAIKGDPIDQMLPESLANLRAGKMEETINAGVYINSDNPPDITALDSAKEIIYYRHIACGDGPNN